MKRDIGKPPNVPAGNVSWPDDPRSAALRAAQDLVPERIREEDDTKI